MMTGTEMLALYVFWLWPKKSVIQMVLNSIMHELFNFWDIFFPLDSNISGTKYVCNDFLFV